MEQKLQEAMKKMQEEIFRIILSSASLYLYGSAALNDFRPGWSDIDILCLSEQPLSEKTAENLVTLRQSMEAEYRDSIYRSFEGNILWEKAFWDKSSCTAVYWGTSGQRITNGCRLDCFSMYELLTDGKVLAGPDRRAKGRLPSYKELREGVLHHYETIREHGGETGESLYSCGWLLDISRCLYTLRTGKVISKTAAGEWALAQGLCPDPQTMVRALEIRKNPKLFLDDPVCRQWCGTLHPKIQEFADVLEQEIKDSDY